MCGNAGDSAHSLGYGVKSVTKRIADADRATSGRDLLGVAAIDADAHAATDRALPTIAADIAADIAAQGGHDRPVARNPARTAGPPRPKSAPRTAVGVVWGRLAWSAAPSTPPDAAMAIDSAGSPILGHLRRPETGPETGFCPVHRCRPAPLMGPHLAACGAAWASPPRMPVGRNIGQTRARRYFAVDKTPPPHGGRTPSPRVSH